MASSGPPSVATKALVKVWNVEIMLNTRLKNRVGVISGRVTAQNGSKFTRPIHGGRLVQFARDDLQAAQKDHHRAAPAPEAHQHQRRQGRFGIVEPGRTLHAQLRQGQVDQPAAWVEQPHPHYHKGHPRENRRQVKYGAENAHAAQPGPHQQRQQQRLPPGRAAHRPGYKGR